VAEKRTGNLFLDSSLSIFASVQIRRRSVQYVLLMTPQYPSELDLEVISR
jgi:hypothetical protein